MNPLRLVVGVLGAACIGGSGVAAADAGAATGVKGARLTATAHVVIQVVIPPSLSLTVFPPDGAQTGGRQPTVTGNLRSASVGATQPSSSTTRGRVILGARAGKLLAEATGCGQSAAARVVCTVSSP